jgi:hypothetical protein
MEQVKVTTEKAPRRIRWKAACLTGLVVGVIFLVAVRGLPWFSSGIIAPGVMGRELPKASPDNSGALAIATAFLHVGVSIIYALILAPLIDRFTVKGAIACGAVVGLGLYLVNYFIFTRIYPEYTGQQELAPIFTHIIFGMAAAGAYKGLVEWGPPVKTHKA